MAIRAIYLESLSSMVHFPFNHVKELDIFIFAVDILWHFLCGGLSAGWIRALGGFGGRSCCGLRLLPWVHVGGLCVLCGCLSNWVVFASDLHCVVVSIEMMPGIVGFILLACVPLNLASWPAWPVNYNCYFLVARCKLLLDFVF